MGWSDHGGGGREGEIMGGGMIDHWGEEQNDDHGGRMD